MLLDKDQSLFGEAEMEEANQLVKDMKQLDVDSQK